MKTSKFRTLIFVTLLALSLDALAQETIPGQGEGGMSDGGGCLIKTPGQSPQLMDLVYTNTPAPAYERGDQIVLTGKQTTLAEAIGYAEIKIEGLRSYARAVELADRWTKRNDLWAETLASALKGMKNMTVNATNFYILRAKPYMCALTPQIPSGSTMTPLAIFSGSLGLILSIPDFNSLDLNMQAGVWIHEAIRSIQILNKQPVAATTMVGITSEVLSGRVNAETLQSRYPLEGKLKSFAGSRERLKKHSIEICQTEFKGEMGKPLKTKYCPTIMQNGLTLELAYGLGSDINKAVDEIYDRTWNREITPAEKKQRDQLRATQHKVYDWIMEFSFAKLQELDASPEVSSLLFAMRKINSNLYQEVTMDIVAEVAEDGSSHMLNSEGNQAVREWIKSIQNMWKQMEREGSIRFSGSSSAGLKTVKAPSQSGGKQGNNK